MRIGLISDWYSPRKGGIESQLHGLVAALRQCDLSPEIVTSYPAGSSGASNYVERLQVALFPGLQLAMPIGLVSAIRNHLQRKNYDLVHIHPSVVSPLCYAAGIAARQLGVPTVFTFHSSLKRIPKLLARCNSTFGWTRDDVEISAVSQQVARQIACLAPSKTVRLLPNGIDLQAWQNNASKATHLNQRIQLVSAMRLTPTKQPMALIYALQNIVRSLEPQGYRIALTIAGEGRLRARVLRLARKLGVSDNLKLTGWLSATALRELYARSDIYISPSSKEAFGIACLEARASGLPVVAMRNTGVTDYIDHNETGILVDDSHNISDAVVKLITTPGQLARMTHANFNASRYAWEDIALMHRQLYAATISRSQNL